MTCIAKRSLYQTPNRDPSGASLEPSSPFRAGKIIIYVNSNLHKLDNGVGALRGQRPIPSKN